jgi:hypothetical protein
MAGRHVLRSDWAGEGGGGGAAERAVRNARRSRIPQPPVASTIEGFI